MCTSIIEIAPAEGMAKRGDDWFALTQTVVAYDHARHAPLGDVITLDFINSTLEPGARAAVELTLEAAKELRAALGFVEAMTLRPTELDVGPMRAAGLTDKDIETVAAVCAAFNMIVRIADSLEFEVPTDDEFARMAPKMAARNYA